MNLKPMSEQSAVSTFSIEYASPARRLSSFIVDYICLIVLNASLALVFFKPQIREYAKIEMENREKKQISEAIKTAEDKEKSEKKIGNWKEILAERAAKIKATPKIKILFLFVTYSTNFIYFFYFLSSKAQATPGQRIFNLMTVKVDGQRMTPADSSKRTVLFIVLSALAVLCIFSKNNIAVYDHLSKTRVIKIK
ncbi:MAG: RDD family protein [Rickettsiales bacterium]|jgi:uncharacterized RDD family membrane protein YckC|nr:RDD family protein [Rickettsiales bacterium]